MSPKSDADPLSHAGFFRSPAPHERFSAILATQEPEGRAALAAIAAKIGATRHPGSESDIPAGSTYLAQFVAHDLDFLTREGAGTGSLLDLALIYGDGPKHDAFCYQVPTEPHQSRYLLRLGRARPTATSPAWGAARDLPRSACPHLDARGVDIKSEVLVPNTFSDSNGLLAQMQTIWALSHNAIAGALVEAKGPRIAFELARAINRGIYCDVIRQDVLGTWLMPRVRAWYAAPRDRRGVISATGRAPREFMDGVGRLGHGLVREIYALNDHMPMVGLRDVMRQTSSGRPGDMPLTEDWLVDFGRFFAIGTTVPQKARALGPHVARPIATGAGLAAGDAAADSIVLRDLVSCTRGGLCSVRTLIARARQGNAHVFEGCFAQDETRWTKAVRDWLPPDIEPEMAERLAGDPPLTLFLMLEAEADRGGRTLGALGSVLMGETLTAALPIETADAALDEARDLVFPDGAPRTMAELIRVLQDHYKFAEGARLHPEEPGSSAASIARSRIGDTKMFDTPTGSGPGAAKSAIPRIEIADYIEMGRLIAQWSVDPKTRPGTVAELAEQLDGIAVVPERIKQVHFVQSTLDTLVLRLPVKEMLEESIERMSDPTGGGQYPLPQFYADHYRPGFGPVMTALDTLLARVGDYTIAQCR